jgi:hypothetical protein
MSGVTDLYVSTRYSVCQAICMFGDANFFFDGLLLTELFHICL